MQKTKKKSTKKTAKKSTRKLKKKVQVVILAPSGQTEKVLLLRTNEKRGSFWQNVTGKVDGKESFVVAALRECAEETGMHFDDIHFFVALPCAFQFHDRWGVDVYEACFVIVMKETFTPRLSKEHESFVWKDCKKITKKDFGFETNFETFKEAMNAC